jgi:transmembrane sensor
MNRKRAVKKLPPQVRREATDWLVAFCEGEVDASGRESFDQWLRTSPEHVRAYLQISALWESAGLLADSNRIDVEQLTRRALSEDNVVVLSVDQRASGIACAESSNARRTKPPRVWQAIAACLFLASALAGGVLWWRSTRAPIYESGPGEQRTLTLPDGSTLQLNARSRVALHFTARQREVELVGGQALFSVARDPGRPFIVHSDATRVTAVGTRFDVYRKTIGTIVTVLEGRVAMRMDSHPEDSVPGLARGASPVLVSAGEQALARYGAPMHVYHANVFAATAWTEGKLMFESAPLREAVAEFNRIDRRRLVIEDDALLGLHITGVFPAADPSQFVAFVRQRFGLTVTETDEEVRLSSVPHK